MSRVRAGLCASVCVLLWISSSLAQQSRTSGNGVIVPHLIRFSGVLKDSSGAPLNGIAGLTFSLYRDQEGGAPLWIESQNVSPDPIGRYEVLLGAEHTDGVPMDLFTSGEARWLAIQVQGQRVDQPRILLVSVPYALKAGDAETVGGLPASAFVRAAALNSNSGTSGMSATAATSLTGTTPLAIGTTAVTTAGGSANQVAKFDANADITSSSLTDTGTNVGIKTKSPATTLDVQGAGTIRGTLSLPAKTNATATAGSSSQGFNLSASAFNSSTAGAVKEAFQWQAEPTGNNTTAPSATLNLLFSSGTGSLIESGMKINSKGIITFAPGQSLPTLSGNETVTGNVTAQQFISKIVTGTPPFSVSSTTQVPNLNASLLGGLSSAGYAKLALANSFGTNQTVSGNVTAHQFVSNIAPGTPPLSVSSTTQVPNLNASLLGGLSSAGYAKLASANGFAANQTITGNGLNVSLGDVSCGSPTWGIVAANRTSPCSNFILGYNDAQPGTFINRPSGGAIHFVEGNGSDQMTIAAGGDVVIGHGVMNDGSGLKHQRVSVLMPVGENFIITTNVTWKTAFPDANYTVIGSWEAGTAPGCVNIVFSNKTSSSITLSVQNACSTGGGEVDIIAIHD